MKKETYLGWLGSLLEAYNMALYPFLAPKILQEQTVVFSYSLLLIGLSIFYPLGAFYYGYLGDKKGRLKICASSTLGLAVATGLMGFIPSGDSAWIFFLILLSAQHFFSGGEYQGSIIFSLEHSEKKGWNSAMSCVSAVAGLLLATGLPHLLQIKQCFLFGGAGGILSYVLRNYCKETPAYLNLVGRRATWPFLKTRWPSIFGSVLVFALFLVIYSYLFLFLPLVYKQEAFFPLVLYGCSMLIAGFLADRIGIEKSMEFGIFFLTITLLPLTYFSTHLLPLQMLLTLFSAFFIAPLHSWMVGHFAAEERCRGIFISSALATALFGGSTVPICLFIYEKYHSVELCALYPLTIALGAFFYFISRSSESVRVSRA